YRQITGQYEEFRNDRLNKLQEVLNAERNLRGILGLPVEDGKRLIPVTAPTMAELKTNWCSGPDDALKRRPERVLARDNVRYHQLIYWWEAIKASRAERLNYMESLKVRYEKIRAGKTNPAGTKEEGPLAFLDTQRRYSAALVKEYDAIAQYNSTLAKLEWAKG